MLKSKQHGNKPGKKTKNKKKQKQNSHVWFDEKVIFNLVEQTNAVLCNGQN
jgi:hypothetical protein